MTTRLRQRLYVPNPRWWLLPAALLLAVAVVGCSTARRRDTPQGPRSLLHYRDPATAAYFRDVYRTGSLYVDFRPALIVDAIFEDATYRRLYVETLRKQFLLGPAEAKRMEAKQQRQFDTRITLLVVAYEGTDEPSPLDRPGARWRLFLRDDDGQLQVPLAIRPIRQGSTRYQYLDKYFSGLDRWSRVYEVDFPKLSKTALKVPVGKHPFEFIVTGVAGTVTLRWDHPGLFYGRPQAKRAAARPAPRGAQAPKPPERTP